MTRNEFTAIYNVAAAITALHARYTDQRSYPVSVVLFDDDTAEAVTFQAYGYWKPERSAVEVFKYQTRPTFGCDDDETITADEYLETFGWRDIDEAIEEARRDATQFNVE